MNDIKLITLTISSLLFASCTSDIDNTQVTSLSVKSPTIIERSTVTPSFLHSLDRNQLVLDSYHDQAPTAWGEFIPGVKTKLDTSEKVIALTLDACGGAHGSQYDEELINYLIDHSIPATLFINARWINHNSDQFLKLANHPLFQIENHGTEHKPLSVNGEIAWGIKGTHSIEEAYQEVMTNHHLITEKTGKEPTMFRPGTAYFDDISVRMLYDLNITPVNYSILGDAGATYTSNQVTDALVNQAEPGAIALLHMNQPNSGTAEGLKEAIPQLLDQGYSFVSLSDHPLK